MSINDKLSEMWRKSREDAGRSQDYIAKRLGVSKRTVQNWESGISSPSHEMGIRWFKELGLQPQPYYLSLFYPEQFESISANVDDKQINEALHTAIEGLPIEAKRKLLYCIYGDHGSSPLAVLDLIVAHLQTPLRARLTVAEVVRNNYEVAEATGTLSHPEHVQPNVELLNKAYYSGKNAVKKGENGYIVFTEEQA